jgi:hypothetical protein
MKDHSAYLQDGGLREEERLGGQSMYFCAVAARVVD